MNNQTWIEKLKIDGRSKTPKEVMVKEQMKDWLINQIVPFLDYLPNIEELVTLTGGSTSYFKAMYDEFILMQWVIKDGSGYRNNTHNLKAHYFDQFIGVYDAIKASGLTPEIRTINKEIVTTDEIGLHIDQVLPSEPLLKITRLYLGNGHPFAVIVSYLPLERLPGLLVADWADEPTGIVLDRVSHQRIVAYDQRLQVMPSESLTATWLHVSEGKPLFRFTAKGLASSGLLLEFNYTWIEPGTFFQFEIKMA